MAIVEIDGDFDFDADLELDLDVDFDFAGRRADDDRRSAGSRFERAGGDHGV